MRKLTKLENIEWDMSTCTAGDYTADIKITPEQYNRFLSTIHEQSYNNESIAYGLKLHLKKEIEEKLTNEVASMGFEEIQRVRIADI